MDDKTDLDLTNGLIAKGREIQVFAQCKLMRDAKDRKTTKNQEDLLIAILMATRGRELKRSREFAHLIFPKVQEHLPTGSKWPKAKDDDESSKKLKRAILEAIRLWENSGQNIFREVFAEK